VNAERELLGGDLFLDEGIEAARNACVAGASLAAALITAAAYYDNPFTGAPALRACMLRFGPLPLKLEAWLPEAARRDLDDRADAPFAPGFGFVLADQASAVQRECHRLVALGVAGPRCGFALEHHLALERAAGPLNATGLAALFFLDRGTPIDVAEQRFLLLRCELAMIEAEKARRAGIRAFPFLSERYVYEGDVPPGARLDVPALMRRLGLDSDA
jgi:hypothetical protein